MGKSINKALTDLFLGLGGNSSALEDNKSVSDYISDLESAIKAYAASAAAEAAELPAVEVANDGQVLAVVNGIWTLCEISAVADTTSGEVTFTFTPVDDDNT